MTTVVKVEGALKPSCAASTRRYADSPDAKMFIKVLFLASVLALLLANLVCNVSILTRESRAPIVDLRTSTLVIEEPATSGAPPEPRLKAVHTATATSIRMNHMKPSFRRMRRLSSESEPIMQLGTIPRHTFEEKRAEMQATGKRNLAVEYELPVNGSDELSSLLFLEATALGISTGRHNTTVPLALKSEAIGFNASLTITCPADGEGDSCILVDPQFKASEHLRELSLTESHQRRLAVRHSHDDINCPLFHCFDGEEHCDEPSPDSYCLVWGEDGMCEERLCKSTFRRQLAWPVIAAGGGGFGAISGFAGAAATGAGLMIGLVWLFSQCSKRPEPNCGYSECPKWVSNHGSGYYECYPCKSNAANLW